MRDFLIGMGQTPMEAERAAAAYFLNPTPEAKPWPPKLMGLDLLPQINPLQVPSTGEPPVFQPNTEGPTQPYPINSKSPYGIGTTGLPYPSIPTPDPIGAVKTNQPKFDWNGSNIGHTYQVTNFPYTGDDANWTGLASDVGSEPPTVGVTGHNVAKAIPEWRYPPEQVGMNPLTVPNIQIPPSGQFNETESNMMEYVYQSHDSDDICAQYNGKIFDLNDTIHRPVPPSEGLGYTTTHPNCICYWKPTGGIKLDLPDTEQQEELTGIHRKIGQRSRFGTLHKIKKDGEMSQRTGHRNFYKKPIHEAIAEIRQQFTWLADDYLEKIKKLAQQSGGKVYLVKASEETITDHRSEGEPYRRKLSADENMRMARTATNHGMDINHNPDWRTEATIIDSEGDPATRSIQMIILETDNEINEAIKNQQITAVSINGGSPRSETIEPCEHGCTNGMCELCLVPRGVILGELDDIGLTWVVTNPSGIYWKGNHIPPAAPGIKSTIIQTI